MHLRMPPEGSNKRMDATSGDRRVAWFPAGSVSYSAASALDHIFDGNHTHDLSKRALDACCVHATARAFKRESVIY